MAEAAKEEFDQPEMPTGILRQCPHCANVMLLMSVAFNRTHTVTKTYQCYTCKAILVVDAGMFE